MGEPLYKAESFKLIGLCMEVHNQLGRGFNEVVYKDALEIEFRQNGIPFSREISYGFHEFAPMNEPLYNPRVNSCKLVKFASHF